MKRETTHEIRALLLASLMVLSVVGGGIAFAGSAAASDQHDLQTSDGGGGDFSYLFTGEDHQTPKGEESGDSTLRVAVGSNGENFPSTGFPAKLTLPENGGITFNTDNQTEGDIDVVVHTTTGATRSVDVDTLQERQVDIGVEFEDGPLSGEPEAIEVSNLSFDASGDASNVSLTWTVNTDEETYPLVVSDFPSGVTATDEASGESARVTAGGSDQTMVGSNGANNLVLEADDTDQPFPSSFNTTLHLDSENVTFHERDEASVDATSEHGNAEVERIDENEVRVRMSEFSVGDTVGSVTIVELDGLTFDVAPNASTDRITWRVGDREDTYTLQPERLEASIDGSYTFPRGKDQQPENDWSDDGIDIVVDGSNKDTSGLHNASEDLLIQIPERSQELGLEFDQSANPTASYGTTNTIGEADPEVENATTISVDLTEDLDGGAGNTITVQGVTFNTTDFVESEPGESDFESRLDVRYTPVNPTSNVSVGTGEDLDVRSPALDTGEPTTFETGQTVENSAGDGQVRVGIEDVEGGQIADGTEIVVRLDTDAGITFNETQSLDARRENGDGSTTQLPDPEVNGENISVEYPSYIDETEAGDTVVIESVDGDGLTFDVESLDAGDSANLLVRTSAGDANVTQLTEPVVEATSNGETDDGVDNVNGTSFEDPPDAINVTDDSLRVRLTDDDDQGIEGLEVNATGSALEQEVEAIDDGDGWYEFNESNGFELTSPDKLTVEADNGTDTVDTTVDVVGDVTIDEPEDGKMTAGEERDVTVNVTGVDGVGLDGVYVNTTSGPIAEDDDDETDDGLATLTLNTTEAGDVTIEASNYSGMKATVEAVANIDTDPSTVTEGETTSVDVRVTGADDEGIDEVEVSASGDPLEETVTNTTDSDGNATLELSPESDGKITVAAEELGTETVISVKEATSGGNDDGSSDESDSSSGGGGGYVGGGGGGLPSDISVVDASVETTETVVGEPVDVTVELTNDGGSGTYEVRVSDGIRTYGSEEVSVGSGETVEVVVEAVFPSSGEFGVAVDDVELGTVVVEPASDEPEIENAVALDTRSVEDASPDEPGVTVEFENVTVEAITFESGADGSAAVADLEALPEDVSGAPGTLIRPVAIEVPGSLADEPATVRFSVSLVDIDGDMADVGFARYSDGEWQRLQPEVVETRGDDVVYEVETPGFSTFAVYEQQQQETPESTDAGTPDDGDVETSGFVGPLGMMVLAVVALLAVLLAVAGARVYKESEP